MPNKTNPRITQDGLKALQDELVQRKEVKREELKATLEEMREAGDLSENEGYHLAIEENQANETRINELETLIKEAKVVTSCKQNVVCVGSEVTVKCDDKKEYTYKIVGQEEADPMENKVSYESPIGKALIDKKKGAKVVFDIPAGKKKCKITKIKRA
ncbi:transcription elongation factor GreA [Candidatus Dojkabacteria bacterium]|nr:transcription elongation factor GreA [Candidatus Dojkabacteria bacterium]